MILLATDPAQPRYGEAFEYLCLAYWEPLYCFARKRGHSPEDAEDLVQEFLTILLERTYLRRFSRSQSRFRSFLLVCFKNFLENERKRSRTQKRGSGTPIASLDVQNAEDRFRAVASDSRTPDKVFDRQWAECLLDRAADRLSEEYRDRGDGRLFDRISVCLKPGEERIDYAATATDLGMNAGALKTAVHRLRKRYRVRLLDEIAETIAEEENPEEELNYLLSVFSD